MHRDVEEIKIERNEDEKIRATYIRCQSALMEQTQDDVQYANT